MKSIVLGGLFLCSLTMPALAAIQGQDVEYKYGGAVFKGYLAYDNAIAGRRPGILVVHEWWGNNDYSRRRANMLAQLGYVAFALDMYGNGKIVQTPDEAQALTKEVNGNQGQARGRFLAALEVLKNFRLTDPNRLAAVGYCFSGGVVLNRVLEGVGLRGVVIFHGSLPVPKTEIKPGQVKTSILVCQGGADPVVTPDQVAAFKQAMDKAGADYNIITYPGAMHAFTNPDADALGRKFDLPIAYNAKGDAMSWKDMRDFLTHIFSG